MKSSNVHDIGLDVTKPDILHVKIKGADQPAHLRRQVNAFAVHFLKSLKVPLATDEISIFYLVFVAEQSGSNLTFLETRKTGCLTTEPI